MGLCSSGRGHGGRAGGPRGPIGHPARPRGPPAAPCPSTSAGSCCPGSSCAASSARPGTCPARHPCSAAPSGTSSAPPETQMPPRISPRARRPRRPGEASPLPPLWTRVLGTGGARPPDSSQAGGGVTGQQTQREVTAGRKQLVQVPRGDNVPPLSLLKVTERRDSGSGHTGPRGTAFHRRRARTSGPGAPLDGTRVGGGGSQQGRQRGRHLRSGTWRPAPPSAPAVPAAHCGRTSAGPRERASAPGAARGARGAGAGGTPACEGLRAGRGCGSGR